VLWLKLVKDFLKVRCRLALLPFLISCLIWLDLVASLPLIKERILVIILLLHFLSLMLGDRKSGSAGMPRPISYAVFCLKKKTRTQYETRQQTFNSQHTSKRDKRSSRHRTAKSLDH